jgi:hypothetical protein
MGRGCIAPIRSLCQHKVDVSGQRHAPAAPHPRERIPHTHWRGGSWVGPRAGVDTEARGKILCLCWRSNPDSPVTHSIVRHYSD